MEELTRCNLCGGTRFSLFAKKQGSVTKEWFRIVRCDECGLVFVSPRLTERENLALYDERYFNGEGFDASVNYVMLDEQGELRREENEGTLRKIALLKPTRDVRILDVGCGTGVLLRALEAAGYTNVTGIELSEYAASVARKNVKGAVHVGDILDVDLPSGGFDVINATEVIEHLRDPLAFFRRVRELLAPNGVFIYSTGNARGLYARMLRGAWPYLHPEGHLFYYDPRTMARYFERAGLAPLRLRDVDRRTRRALLAAEDQITRSQLLYVGNSDRGTKGKIFRLISALDNRVLMRAMTLAVGKAMLPIAVNRSA